MDRCQLLTPTESTFMGEGAKPLLGMISLVAPNPREIRETLLQASGSGSGFRI